MIMVEMHVHSRQNIPLKVMLDLRELSGEIPHMMVVDKRDRRHGFMIVVTTPFLAHQLVADEITERFGTRRVFSASDDPVEIVQQVMVQRDAEPDQLLHPTLSMLRFYNSCYDYSEAADAGQAEMTTPEGGLLKTVDRSAYSPSTGR